MGCECSKFKPECAVGKELFMKWISIGALTRLPGFDAVSRETRGAIQSDKSDAEEAYNQHCRG